ncbi:MAG: polyamine ABC transporter substrate-binding protein [Gammaproteobacteria bacterium]|nr:polyamine ABC transporter substrate-binding protein [Gammaproteobacteria bacterium]
MAARLRYLLPAFLACVAAGAAAAGEAPVVNVYNWADYIGPTTIKDFERETGIKVNYDIYDTSEIVDAKVMAGGSGYDVVLHSATFSHRLLKHGIFRPLDRSKLTNWHHLDDRLLALFEPFDPGIRHSAPYMWGTMGFAYNLDMVRERMPDAPLDSAALVFDPAIVSRFADCGVSLLDSPTDVIPTAMLYLGHEANSVDPQQLKEAEDLLKKIRPYIKYFSSTKMLVDMPNKEVCIGMSWSGDYSVAWTRAREAGIAINLGYSVPREGAPYWLDAAYVPADAPHPDNAHVFINFLLRPDVIAAISNFTGYANANRDATPLVKQEFRDNPGIYPDERFMQRMHWTAVLDPKVERLRSRAWTRVKTGL